MKDYSALELSRMTPVQLEHWKDQVDAQHSRWIMDGDLETAAELKRAGWTPEPLTNASAMFQWRWRRHGRRPGKPGRLFLSPVQAINALHRERSART
jgi:hypothetical protein